MTQTYQPVVLVDTTNLSRDEWLAHRRCGIGGSDAAAVLGISPWRTARDLYYDKLGIAEVQPDEEAGFYCPIEHTAENVLEHLFCVFNVCPPKDYSGRSLSVSDVVELFDDKERRYYYCEPAGFQATDFSPMLAKRAKPA